MVFHNTLIVFFDELKRTIRAVGISVVVLTLMVFLLTPQLLHIIQSHLSEKLYFFSVSGPFLAHVKIALFASVYILTPWLMTVFWRALGKPFELKAGQIFFFVLFTCMLFYSGTIFCYFITLPLGVEFLLGFGSEQLKPVISIGRFVNFVTLFILAFGIIFQLPIFMVFSAKVSICTRQFFERNRRYALLVIAIVSALLTPTPDVVNMMLMAGPLYLLYESGIIIVRLMGLGE